MGSISKIKTTDRGFTIEHSRWEKWFGRWEKIGRSKAHLSELLHGEERKWSLGEAIWLLGKIRTIQSPTLLSYFIVKK